jgi:hypothetical protein
MDSDAIAGRVNRIVASVLNVRDGLVLPGMRLTSQPLLRDEIALQIEAEYGLPAYQQAGSPSWIDRCPTVQDVSDHVAAWVEARAGAARA